MSVAAAISSLAPELLVEVFAWSSAAVVLRGPAPQVVLSHVCRWWREVALSCSFLWATIRVIGRFSAAEVATWLLRSNGRPLRIFVQSSVARNVHPGLYVNQDRLLGPLEGAPETSRDRVGYMVSFSSRTGRLVSVGPPEFSRDQEHLSLALTRDDWDTLIALLVPHASRWTVAEFTLHSCQMFRSLQRAISLAGQFAALASYAVILSPPHALRDHTDSQSLIIPAPSLRRLVLWGINIDWGMVEPIARRMVELDIEVDGLHFPQSPAIRRAHCWSQLVGFTLRSYGFRGAPIALEFPNLVTLALERLEPADLLNALVYFGTPSLERLGVDFVAGGDRNYAECVEELSIRRPYWSALLHLSVGGTPWWNWISVSRTVGGLSRLRSLSLWRCEDAEAWLDELANGTSLPSLAELHAPLGVLQSEIRGALRRRREAGSPIKTLYVGQMLYRRHTALEVEVQEVHPRTIYNGPCF